MFIVPKKELYYRYDSNIAAVTIPRVNENANTLKLSLTTLVLGTCNIIPIYVCWSYACVVIAVCISFQQKYPLSADEIA